MKLSKVNFKEEEWKVLAYMIAFIVLAGIVVYLNVLWYHTYVKPRCIDSWLPNEGKPDSCVVWSCGYTSASNPNITDLCVCNQQDNSCEPRGNKT